MYSLKSVAETEISLDADVKRGLSDVEAKARLEKYGENRLKEEKEKGQLYIMHIHIVLENGVRQQLDGGQRCFQLVGCIGHKLPSLIFGYLQTIGQMVKFVTQERQFIIAAKDKLVIVIAFL